MKYLNLNILYCTYMLTPIRNILLIINLVTFCSKLSVRKPYIIYLSENCVLAYIRVHISKPLLFRTWKVVIGCYFTADSLSGSANSRTLSHFNKTSLSDSGNNFYCVPPKLFNNIYLQLYMLYFINILGVINKEMPFSTGIYYYSLYI